MLMAGFPLDIRGVMVYNQFQKEVVGPQKTNG